VSELLHNKSCPFDFLDWRKEKIKKLHAGKSCVMAITDNESVLQKVLDENLAARTEYWNNIKSISISQTFPGLAIGLVNDGTCMVSKRALRHCCRITERNFDEINEQIKSLKGIIELIVSDAIFALDHFGIVHHIPLWKKDEYKDISTWCNINHIAVGNQSSVFGITQDGTIVCAGGNTSNGPRGNLKKSLATIEHVVDICVLGSECEEIMIALSDGRIVDSTGNDYNIQHIGKWPVFTNNFLLASIRSNGERIKCKEYGCCYIDKDTTTKIEKSKVSDIVIGTDDSSAPFVVWINQ
jgi:hypothetical protein